MPTPSVKQRSDGPGSPLLVEPAHLWSPPQELTLGPAVSQLNGDIGFAPDPEQNMMLDATFAEQPATYLPALFAIAAAACRQNLKTGWLLQTIIGWAFITKDPVITYTAHRWKTVEKTMSTLDQVLSGSDYLRPRIAHFYTGNNNPHLELRNGVNVYFTTRAAGFGRGDTGDKLIFDEALFLEQWQRGAVVSSLATRHRAQILYAGSAGLRGSAVWREVRDRGYAGCGCPVHVAERAKNSGRADLDMRLFWAEWKMDEPDVACADGDDCTHSRTAVGCALDDEEQLLKANTAAVVRPSQRITLDFLRQARKEMSPQEYGREHGGWWDDPPAEQKAQTPSIDVTLWDRLTIVEEQVPKRMPAFAVHLDKDRAWATIGACGEGPFGSRYVETVRHKRGTRWVVEDLVELDAVHGPITVGVDGGSGAKTLIEPLREAGITVVVFGVDDVIRSAGEFVDAVREEEVVHGPQKSLHNAMEVSWTRPIGARGGFGFAETVDAPTGPLIAVSFAKYVFENQHYDLNDSIF